MEWQDGILVCGLSLHPFDSCRLGNGIVFKYSTLILLLLLAVKCGEADVFDELYLRFWKKGHGRAVE